MTDYTEELSGYLESDDPAKVRKGLSMAKKIGRPVLGFTGDGELGVLWVNALKVQYHNSPDKIGSNSQLISEAIDEILVGVKPRKEPNVIYEYEDEDMQLTGSFYYVEYLYDKDGEHAEEVPCDKNGNAL